jgi:hypothetical protein
MKKIRLLRPLPSSGVFLLTLFLAADQYLMDKFRTHFSAAQRVNDMDVSHKKESLARRDSSQKLACGRRAGCQ